MNNVFVDLGLVFAGTMAIVAAVYVTMQLGIARNFFNAGCYGRIALLETIHARVVVPLAAAALDGAKNYSFVTMIYVMVVVISLVCHYVAFRLGHDWTRSARRERRSESFGLARRT